MMRAGRRRGMPALSLLPCSLPAGAAAQAISPTGAGIPARTVCEALQGREQYHGRSVIIAGRFGATEEGSWLDVTERN